MYGLSYHNFVSFTDNPSVPHTLDYSGNQGFTKLVSSTDNSYNAVKSVFISMAATNACTKGAKNGIIRTNYFI